MTSPGGAGREDRFSVLRERKFLEVRNDQEKRRIVYQENHQP